MDIKFLFDDLQEFFHNTIKDAHPIPTSSDYDWENYRYCSHLFRQAHVERYTKNNLDVLHFVVLPHVDYPTPIFGFDAISSLKSQTVSGLFLDWSPVGSSDYDWTTPTLDNLPKRNLPEWGTSIFSKQFIATEKLSYEQFLIALPDIKYAYTRYTDLIKNDQMLYDNSYTTMTIEYQNKYCAQQALNPRTRAALTHEIGQDKAKKFMETILFPQVLPLVDWNRVL